MSKEIYCNACGAKIPDIMHCSVYRPAGGYSCDTVYICEKCSERTSLIIIKNNGDATELGEEIVHDKED